MKIDFQDLFALDTNTDTGAGVASGMRGKKFENGRDARKDLAGADVGCSR